MNVSINADVYINLIAYGKQFSDEWQSFIMKRDKSTLDLYRLENVDKIQDDTVKLSLISGYEEDVKPFSVE